MMNLKNQNSNCLFRLVLERLGQWLKTVCDCSEGLKIRNLGPKDTGDLSYVQSLEGRLVL